MVAFDTLAPKDRAEASSVFHLLRNMGSSFFISISIAEIVRATGANYAYMTELVSHYSRVLSLPWAMGGWDADSVGGLARLSKEINRQAAMLGYINAFGLYTLCSALAIPLILMVRPGRRSR